MKDLLQTLEMVWVGLPPKLKAEWDGDIRKAIKRAEEKLKEPTLEKMIDHLLKKHDDIGIRYCRDNGGYMIFHNPPGGRAILTRGFDLRNCIIEAMRVKNCLLPGIIIKEKTVCARCYHCGRIIRGNHKCTQ